MIRHQDTRAPFHGDPKARRTHGTGPVTDALG
jgi:hypothetical protein